FFQLVPGDAGWPTKLAVGAWARLMALNDHLKKCFRQVVGAGGAGAAEPAGLVDERGCRHRHGAAGQLYAQSCDQQPGTHGTAHKKTPPPPATNLRGTFFQACPHKPSASRRSIHDAICASPVVRWIMEDGSLRNKETRALPQAGLLCLTMLPAGNGRRLKRHA